jgi:hypothetical protein
VATKKPPAKMHGWEITLIRERGKFLGYVEAPDEETAIGEAIKQFEIRNPEQHRRLIARARLDDVLATVHDGGFHA